MGINNRKRSRRATMQSESSNVSKISIDDITIGMTLEDVFNNEGKLLLTSVTISSSEQIDRLRRQGVRYAYISNSLKVKSSPDPEPALSEEELIALREQSYYKELSRAKEVHLTTLATARSTLQAIRMGRQVKIEAIERAAEGVVASILRNPDALVSLAQIKGYDEYTYVHSVNVGILISSLVYSMGYPKDKILEAGMGGLLHDIGKMRVPENVLNKPGRYTSDEFAIMKKHPEAGLRILEDIHTISDFSKKVIIQHHERYNGKGYPFGLTNSDIEEIGLIAAVADVYDAMTTDRIYRPAWTPQRALAMIFNGCDLEYSRHIVELFTKHLGIYPVGSFVRLISGEMGVVIRVDQGAILAPDVLVLFNENGRRLEKPVEYKLYSLQKTEKAKLYRIEISLNPNDFNVNISNYIQSPPFG